MKFIFHSDSGHGWTEVDIDLLHKLNIQDKITTYSYLRGNKAYLEEDCDTGTLIQALKSINEPFEIEVDLYKDYSPIREYSRYTFSNMGA